MQTGNAWKILIFVYTNIDIPRQPVYTGHMRRVENHPILETPDPKIDQVTFTFEGSILRGVPGEPIAAALAAAGVRDLHYSHKHKTPRGLFCGIGQCQECVMVVDGIPNIRSCITPLRGGMDIRRQHGRGVMPGSRDE